SLLEDDFKKTLQRFLKEPDSFQRFFTKGEDDGFNFKLSTFQKTEYEIVGLLKLLDKNKLFDLEKHLKPLGFETIKEWHKKRKESEKPFIAVERKTSSRPVDEKEFKQLIDFANKTYPKVIPFLCLIRHAGLQVEDVVRISPADIITREPPFWFVNVKGSEEKERKSMPRVTPLFVPEYAKGWLQKWERIDSREVIHFLENFRNKYESDIDVKRLRMWYFYFLLSLDIPLSAIAWITGAKESEGIRRYQNELKEFLDEPPEKYIEENLLKWRESGKIHKVIGKSIIETAKVVYGLK
ncbi:MAG: hypothetical protein QXI58_05860, partial [Candidatus Micrarchaeia archaeon]